MVIEKDSIIYRELYTNLDKSGHSFLMSGFFVFVLF